MQSLALSRPTAAHALRGPRVPIEWTCNPWREDAARASASLVGAIVLVALACVSRLPLPACTALVLGIVALTAPGFLPSAYRVDERGASTRLAFLPWRSLRWEQVKSATLRSGGLLVEPSGGVRFVTRLQVWALRLPAGVDDGGTRERLRAWRDSERDAHAG